MIQARQQIGLACILLVGLGACTKESELPPEPPAAELCAYNSALDGLPAAESYVYSWSCQGQVDPAGQSLTAAAVADDCTTGVWPDLDDTGAVCPTVSSAERTDPVSGKVLPSDDPRPLPSEIPITESGSFLPADLPDGWPKTMRVVAWNMEYTAHFDEQLAAVMNHPELSKADVFLLSEVDRCSKRNGMRRAARDLAKALQADYVYGIEFVELDIGRDIGGDTGQAILSRRPLQSAALTCHSSQNDWFASEGEPRLGQRVLLHADVPIGDSSVRLYAVHLESNDVFGDKRAVQAKELLDVVQQRACERPQIVAGDFNAPYCGAPELQLLRDVGFSDAIGLAGDTEPTHSAGFRLDYAWTKGLRVVAGGVIRHLGASDHDALWVDLELE